MNALTTAARFGHRNPELPLDRNGVAARADPAGATGWRELGPACITCLPDAGGDPDFALIAGNSLDALLQARDGHFAHGYTPADDLARPEHWLLNEAARRIVYAIEDRQFRRRGWRATHARHIAQAGAFLLAAADAHQLAALAESSEIGMAEAEALS